MSGIEVIFMFLLTCFALAISTLWVQGLLLIFLCILLNIKHNIIPMKVDLYVLDDPHFMVNKIKPSL